MTEPLIVVVPGEPNTNHRPRTVPGRKRPITDPEHRAWKARVTLCGRQAKVAWVRAHGVWRMDVRYAAVVVIHSAKVRHPDADNGRGALDALQGVLWRSDQRCHPVVYDVQQSGPPRLTVQVLPWVRGKQEVVLSLDVVEVGA